ncbi:EAL and HDOD domain-containing protein [Vibrio cholerae]
MKAFYSKQFILNRDAKKIGCEVFYRDSMSSLQYPKEISKIESTENLVLNMLLSLEHFYENDEMIFINFTYDSLLKKLPLLFDKKRLVIEILEDCYPNSELLNLVKMYHSEGYEIALDDFTYTDDWREFLPYVKYIKIDIKINPIQKIADTIEKVQLEIGKNELYFIAEKIETKDELDFCLAMSFTYFQGFYLDKGRLCNINCIDVSSLNIKNSKYILKNISKNNFSDSVFYDDIILLYGLMKVAINIDEGFENNGIKATLLFLGVERVKVFLSLLITREDKVVKSNLSFIYKRKFKRIKYILDRSDGIVNIQCDYLCIACAIYSISLYKNIHDLVKLLNVDNEVIKSILYRDDQLGFLFDMTDEYDWISSAHR